MNKNTFRHISGAALLLICGIISTVSHAEHALFSHLDRAVVEQIKQHEGFTGVVGIYSASDNRISRQYAMGLANVEKRLAFTADTVVDMGSVTKQFTGAAIVKLASQGRLSYEDTLDRHLSGLKPHIGKLSLHQLLTHTGGITDKTGDDYESLTLPDLIKRLNAQPLQYELGSHHYSNLGYSLLAAVIEKASGQSYEKFLHQTFFKPLGMEHTGYLLPKFTDNEVANGYSQKGNWGQSHQKNWSHDGPYWNLRGNGGILSTVSDMAKWLKGLHGDKVFNNTEKKEYFGRYVQEYPEMLSFYGYGWVGEDISDTRRLIWHNGSNGVFTAEVRYYPEDDLFFIAVSNRADSPVWHLSEPMHEVIASYK